MEDINHNCEQFFTAVGDSDNDSGISTRFQTPSKPSLERMPSVNTITDLIHKLHDLEEQERNLINHILELKLDLEAMVRPSSPFRKKTKKSEEIIQLESIRSSKVEIMRSAVTHVAFVKAEVASNMDDFIHSKSLKAAIYVSPSMSIDNIDSSEDDLLPLLLGRCFNLSLNLKILHQCSYCDFAIGGRVFSDFKILEDHLKARLTEAVNVSAIEAVKKAKKKAEAAKNLQKAEENFSGLKISKPSMLKRLKLPKLSHK